MTFQIRHESIIEVLILVGLFLLLLTAAFMFIVREMTAAVIITLILAIAVIILIAVALTAKTLIDVGEQTVTVTRLFMKKTFAVSDIRDLRIERYTRRHKNHYKEQRMRMTVLLGNGKKTVLTDTAMESTGGFLLRSSRELPDEDVPLFRAYQLIQANRN